jgi:ClpP class serine protease
MAKAKDTTPEVEKPAQTISELEALRARVAELEAQNANLSTKAASIWTAEEEQRYKFIRGLGTNHEVAAQAIQDQRDWDAHPDHPKNKTK